MFQPRLGDDDEYCHMQCDASRCTWTDRLCMRACVRARLAATVTAVPKMQVVRTSADGLLGGFFAAAWGSLLALCTHMRVRVRVCMHACVCMYAHTCEWFGAFAAILQM